MTTDKPRRDKVYSYRPPRHRRAEFEAMVAESGLSVNAFLTECAIEHSRYRRAERQMLAQLLGQCAGIADRLREIQFSGADNSILLIEAMRDELSLIRTELMERMRRES
ncbi:MAG: hypothetical protein KDE25_02930 [Novosphingobium sp.]|nr:hypothetical protein [Novosphingobium sp.]